MRKIPESRAFIHIQVHVAKVNSRVDLMPGFNVSALNVHVGRSGLQANLLPIESFLYCNVFANCPRRALAIILVRLLVVFLLIAQSFASGESVDAA